jgi:hypothetical protein
VSPLYCISVRIMAVHPCSASPNASNLRFLFSSPESSDLHCDCLLREALHALTRVPSSVRVVSRRRRRPSSRSRRLRDPRIFQCADHHDALYCDSFGVGRLFTVYMNPFSRSPSRWWYMYLLTHFRSILQYLFMIIYYYNIRVPSAVT